MEDQRRSRSRSGSLMSVVKAYEPVLVIDNVAGGTGTPSKTLCIECCGSRMFIGTLEGILYEYFMPEDHLKTFYQKVRQVVLTRRAGQHPILFIRAASAIDSLIILSGNNLALFDIQTLEIKGSQGIGNVTNVGVDENPISGDPFIVELCFSRKSTIGLGQATEQGFTITREINIEAPALCLSMESGLICSALVNGYYVMINSLTKTGKPMQLCTFDQKDKPRAVHVNKEEFLVLGPGGLGVFVTKAGTSERPPISWPDKVSQVSVHNYMNVVAIGENSVFIHSLVDFNSCHTIEFAGVKCLSLSEGNLYLGTSRSLYRLRPISVEQQIDELLAREEIDKALGILQLSNLQSEVQHLLLRKIHLKAVFVHIANLDLKAAKESVVESGIDLREIISLFPNILPSSSTFTRQLPSLHDFIDVESIIKGDEEKLRELGQFVLNLLLAHKSIGISKDLSTSLVKLSMDFDPETSFKEVLTMVQHLHLGLFNIIEWSEGRKYFSSLAHVYDGLGESQKALDIWLDILEGKLEDSPMQHFQGIPVVVQSLAKVYDPVLLWKYFERLVQIEPKEAILVFTQRPISNEFPPLRVAEKLSKKWSQLAILYLEDCIKEKDVQDEDCHTYLATLYIDQIIGGDEQLRERLRQFLIDSDCLKIQFLIGRLKNTNLRHELAILHGKTGDHVPALLVFTKELDDHKMAREYCVKLKNLTERKKALLELIQIYLSAEQESQSPRKEESVRKTLDVLCDFCEEFDFTLVLPLLPDTWSIQNVSNVLHRAMRTSLQKRRMASIKSALTRRVYLDKQLENFESNQGYLIEPGSVCDGCSKTFDLTDPIIHVEGQILHEKCK